MAGPRQAQIFLVDGYALIYRTFFAFMGRPLRSSHGEDTSVAWGVTLFLRKLLSEWQPDYIAAVFDGPQAGSFRQRLYPRYKATRDKLNASEQIEMHHALARVEQLLAAFRIAAISHPGYEADDIIGTLARQAVAEGVDAVIVSGDLDFYQLVGPHIRVLEPGRGGRAFVEPQWVGPAEARARIGVPPAQVTDYIALVGDRSDNIPGVKGIGDKTARALLARYGTLEAIVAHADSVTPPRARSALQEHAETARLSKRLATIDTHAPVVLALPTLRRRPPNIEALRSLYAALEFYSLLPELGGQGAPDVFPEAVSTPAAATALARRLGAPRQIALEAFGTADGESPDAQLVGLALSWAPQHCAYLPFGHQRGSNLPSLTDPQMEPLRALLTSPDVEKVGHDLKRVLLLLEGAGVELEGPLADTMIAAYCFDASRRDYALEVVSLEHTGEQPPSLKELGGRPQLHAPPALARLGCARAAATLRLLPQLQTAMRARSQQRLFAEIEMPLVRVLAAMQRTGIAVDTAPLRHLEGHLRDGLERLQAELFTIAGHPFNLDSYQQLAQVLFEELGLPIIKRTKTGPSTDADVLAELARRGHRVAVLLSHYRERQKLLSTYVHALPQWINRQTGRLHTHFLQTGSVTGRLSSAAPNLQNIPIRSELGATLRKAFVASPSAELLVADYSQIELRVVAHLAADQAFIEAFRAGRDIHTETAAQLFHVAPERITPKQRDTAKMVNYATLYGQAPGTLAQRLGVTLADAESFTRHYFERFPAIAAWLRQQIAHAYEHGYVETLLGRRRYIPEMHSNNPRIRAAGERAARNAPIQGSAADLIKLAMLSVDQRLSAAGTRSRMVLQLHDALMLDVPKAELTAVGHLVRDAMVHVVALRVPLEVDMGSGRSWYEAKHAQV